MTECLVSGRTLPQAYNAALKRLKKDGELVECPAYNTRQLECAMTIIVLSPLEEPMISRMMPGGPADLQQYTMEMLDGILDFEVKRGNWPYTYHDRMTNWGKYGLDQVAFVIEELRRDPYSRRAVIDVRHNSEDTLIDDPACLQHIQFFLRPSIYTRKPVLHCKALFRSNDAVKAAFMNMYAIIRLQERIANELGAVVGPYTHRANSFHAYERDFDLLDSYVERITLAELRGTPNTTYAFKGDWDELMAEACVDIWNKVTHRMYDAQKPAADAEPAPKAQPEKAQRPKVIAVDFDGTLSDGVWPEIGKPINITFDYLKDRKAKGAKLILWTCRVGLHLDAAVAWCKMHGLEFDAVNENLPETIEAFGGDCRKVCADVYLDDKGGVPTDMVNWWMKEIGMLEEEEAQV